MKTGRALAHPPCGSFARAQKEYEPCDGLHARRHRLSLSLFLCVCVCVARGFFCFLLLTVWWYCRPVCVGRACSVKKNKQKNKAKTRRPLFFLFFGQFEERVPRAAVHSFDGHHFFSQQWFSFFGLYQLLRGFFFKPNSQRGASNWKDQLRFSRLKNFFLFWEVGEKDSKSFK